MQVLCFLPSESECRVRRLKVGSQAWQLPALRKHTQLASSRSSDSDWVLQKSNSLHPQNKLPPKYSYPTDTFALPEFATNASQPYRVILPLTRT